MAIGGFTVTARAVLNLLHGGIGMRQRTAGAELQLTSARLARHYLDKNTMHRIGEACLKENCVRCVTVILISTEVHHEYGNGTPP